MNEWMDGLLLFHKKNTELIVMKLGKLARVSE